MKLVNIPIGELTEHPRNYRRHSDRQLAELQTSLREYGWQRNVVVSKDRFILAGHGIVEAARRNGETQIPCEVQEHLHTAPEAEKFLALENTVSRLAEDDDTALSALLADVQRTVGLDGTGYNDAELDALIAEVAAQNEPEPTEDPGAQVDRAAELQAKWGTERGQVWQVGRHRLMCGDSTNTEDVGRLLGQVKPSLTLTDPPYGIGYEYATQTDYPEENEALVQAAMTLAPGGKVWTPGLMNLRRDLAKNKSAKCLAWVKGFATAGNGLGGASTWEPVLVVDPPNTKLANDVLEYRTDRLDISSTSLRKFHPCPKPLQLWCVLMEAFGAEVVYDPFLGSGTTMVAAERLGRVCYGMELEPKYVAVSLERMAGMGLEPVLTGD